MKNQLRHLSHGGLVSLRKNRSMRQGVNKLKHFCLYKWRPKIDTSKEFYSIGPWKCPSQNFAKLNVTRPTQIVCKHSFRSGDNMLRSHHRDELIFCLTHPFATPTDSKFPAENSQNCFPPLSLSLFYLPPS